MTLFDVLALGPQPMAHTIRDKKKLLNRVRRIRGQIEAVERALDQEQDCSTILLTIAACRGAILPPLVAEVVARLPEEVQDWLLYETDHVFIGGSGQGGGFFELRRHPSEMKDGFINIRIVFLSEQLATMSKDEALWTIAHEIAHSRPIHDTGGFDAEVEADRLAQEWGFKGPEDRAAERERYK